MKIPRLGWSLPAAALLTVAAAAAQAQDAPADSASHTVKRGDTLWDIAAAYLGDAYLWPEIYRLNTDQIEDPHWIYPGEILQLPGRAGAVAQAPSGPREGQSEEQPRRSYGPTVFTPRMTARSGSRDREAAAPPARVPFGDVLRAPYFDQEGGPRGPGRILFGTDIPGVDKERHTTNFLLFDRLLITPPVGSLAAIGERYVAYEEGSRIEGVGTEVIPLAIVEVVRPPRNGEGAIAQVIQLFGQLGADTHLVPLDTAGAGATGLPVAVSGVGARGAIVRAIHRPAVMPSLNYYVLFDLTAKDGMKLGDEIEIYRPRQEQDGAPMVPEVLIATGQVVKVTAYGATARVTTQRQPAIRVGESVRVTARMP